MQWQIVGSHTYLQRVLYHVLDMLISGWFCGCPSSSKSWPPSPRCFWAPDDMGQVHPACQVAHSHLPNGDAFLSKDLPKIIILKIIILKILLLNILILNLLLLNFLLKLLPWSEWLGGQDGVPFRTVYSRSPTSRTASPSTHTAFINHTLAPRQDEPRWSRGPRILQ